jgi:hypothetical protein
MSLKDLHTSKIVLLFRLLMADFLNLSSFTGVVTAQDVSA